MIWKILEKVEIGRWMENRSVNRNTVYSQRVLLAPACKFHMQARWDQSQNGLLVCCWCEMLHVSEWSLGWIVRVFLLRQKLDSNQPTAKWRARPARLDSFEIKDLSESEDDTHMCVYIYNIFIYIYIFMYTVYFNHIPFFMKGSW